MNLRTNISQNSRFRVALAAIIAVLLLSALALRTGNVVQAVRLNTFSVDIARAIAGEEVSSVTTADSGSSLPEQERLWGMLASKNGDITTADAFFVKAIKGSANMVPLVRYARPKDDTLSNLAYTLYPTLPDAPAWRGDALAKSQPQEALKLYREATALDPLNNILWGKTGQLAQTLGQNDIARDAYSKACDLTPDLFAACDNAARLSYRSGAWDRVIYYFVREKSPSTPSDWVLMIKAAQKLGRTADANAYLAQARKANPADYNTLLAKQP